MLVGRQGGGDALRARAGCRDTYHGDDEERGENTLVDPHLTLRLDPGERLQWEPTGAAAEAIHRDVELVHQGHEQVRERRLVRIP